MPYCSTCKKEVSDEERHRWKWHPKNKYEELWSQHAKEGFKNWTGSSFFEDDPYY